jgi:type II secretory pathway pseudopilin PulG
MTIGKVITTGLGIGLVGVGVAAAVTNPSPQEYQEYAVQALSAYARQEVCSQQEQSFLRQGCEVMIQTLQPTLHDIFARNTQRQNFIVFSLYISDISPVQITPLFPDTDLPSYHFETLAAFQQFHTYQVESRRTN